MADPDTAQLHDVQRLYGETDAVSITWAEFMQVWSALPELPEVLLQGDPPNSVFNEWFNTCTGKLQEVTGIPPSTCDN